MKHALAVVLLLLPLALRAAEPKLPELKYSYAVTWKGVSLGDAVITLRPHNGPDCYRYESVTDPVGMVRMFYGKPRETSDFCVVNGRVVPRRFAFHNPKDEDASFSLEFDIAAGKVRDNRGRVRDIPANAQDRFGLQQAVRLWAVGQAYKKEAETVDFAMVDDRRVKPYRFAITAYEEIEIPAGRFETVLVQRIDDPRKTSKFWLAPARDYMPIKVEQVKGGDTDLRMVLKSR
jgi:hypothetical protein